MMTKNFTSTYLALGSVLNLLGDRAPPPLQPEPELLPFEDQGGEMGDLGEELECDPGEVILICAQLLARLSSLGVLSTVILKFGYSEKSTKLKKNLPLKN